MNFNNQIIVGIFSSFLLANAAYAANKTGVADSLNAGDSRLDLNYLYLGVTYNGTTSSSTSSLDYAAKSTGSYLIAAYLFGITDRLNLAVTQGYSRTSSETSWTSAPNSYVYTSKTEGATNPSIGARYLLSDKKNGPMGLLIYGTFIPASASSDAGVAQIETNGVVTQAGITGKAGNSASSSSIGATVIRPVAMGDAYVTFSYSATGEQSTSGGAAKSGALSVIQMGLENHASSTATVRPYVNVIYTGSGYSGTTQIASHVDYSLGLEAIKDVTKSVSLSVTGEYGSTKSESSSTSGSKNSLSGNYYLLGVRGMFFF
jgi:hypothetical protein